MLDELKELVQLLNSLPHLALWVAAGFWAYKVIVIGSIFGVIKLAIDRTHSWLTKEKVVIHQWAWNDMYMVDPERVKAIIHRLSLYEGSHDKGNILNSSGVRMMQEAVEQYIERNPKK